MLLLIMDPAASISFKLFRGQESKTSRGLCFPGKHLESLDEMISFLQHNIEENLSYIKSIDSTGKISKQSMLFTLSSL